LRIKGTKDEVTQKLSTGTRQLKAHELTYFGVSSPTNKTTDTNVTKSPFVQLSTKNKSSSVINSSLSSSSSSVSVKASHKTATNTQMSSKILVNHQKPDLIMHHQQKYDSTAAPELTSSEKKSMIEALDSCIDETKNLEPLYENLYQNNNNKQQYDRKLDLARDKIILDELTRAADEIMNVSIFCCVNFFFCQFTLGVLYSNYHYIRIRINVRRVSTFLLLTLLKCNLFLSFFNPILFHFLSSCSFIFLFLFSMSFSSVFHLILHYSLFIKYPF
jgi:hypothetical protein